MEEVTICAKGLKTLDGHEDLHSPSEIERLWVENGESLQDIGALAALESLQSLSLRDCHSLTSIAALAPLTDLSLLELDCRSLRSLDGLDGMYSLSELDLCDSDALEDVEAIADLTNLDQVRPSAAPIWLTTRVLWDLCEDGPKGGRLSRDILDAEIGCCDGCWQSRYNHCCYCGDCPGRCEHAVLTTGPTRVSEQGGLTNPFLWGCSDASESDPIGELYAEFQALVSDLQVWVDTAEAASIEEKVFALDQDTMGGVAIRNPGGDGVPFFARTYVGQVDNAEWLEHSGIEMVWCEYETAGMGCDQVRICYSLDRPGCEAYVKECARDYIEPLKAIRKAVRGWDKPAGG